MLERAIDASDGGRPHPGLLHMYVHTMEMSPFPERALRAADQLRDLVPDAGHLVHMPTHIDVLCGNYRDVVTGNRRAIVADRKFLEREGALNFYTLYRCHDYHFTIYGAMFLGQPEPALEAAAELQATLTEELLRIEVPVMADWLEGFVPMRLHVLVRFGMWDAILAEPFPDDAQLYCVTTAMLHYAKGVAHAATGDLAAADEQRRLFREAYARVPDTRYLFNNTCLDALAVAGAMLDGEIEYRRGHFDAAFAHLRRSVELDDNMLYDEPWAWMQPTRHALGALLLEQGHVEQAEAVYRADLGLDSTLSRPCQHPDNVWSLHGFHECLTRLGKQAEADIVRPAAAAGAGPGDGAGAKLLLLPHDARRLSGLKDAPRPADISRDEGCSTRTCLRGVRRVPVRGREPGRDRRGARRAGRARRDHPARVPEAAGGAARGADQQPHRARGDEDHGHGRRRPHLRPGVQVGRQAARAPVLEEAPREDHGRADAAACVHAGRAGRRAVLAGDGHPVSLTAASARSA